MKISKKNSTELHKRYKKYIGKSFYNKETDHIIKILNIYIKPNDNDVMFKLSNGETCNIAYFNNYLKEDIIQ